MERYSVTSLVGGAWSYEMFYRREDVFRKEVSSLERLLPFASGKVSLAKQRQTTIAAFFHHRNGTPPVTASVAPDM